MGGPEQQHIDGAHDLHELVDKTNLQEAVNNDTLLTNNGLTEEGKDKMQEMVNKIGSQVNKLCSKDSLSCTENIGKYLAEMSYETLSIEHDDFKKMGEFVPEFKAEVIKMGASAFTERMTLIKESVGNIVSQYPDYIKKEFEAYNKGGKKGELSEQAQKAYDEISSKISISIAEIDKKVASNIDNKSADLYGKLLPIMKERLKGISLLGEEDNIIINNG